MPLPVIWLHIACAPLGNGTAEVAQVKICKCSNMGEAQHCIVLGSHFRHSYVGSGHNSFTKRSPGPCKDRGWGGGGREIDSETGSSDHLVLFVRSRGKRCRAGNMRMYGGRAQPHL